MDSIVLRIQRACAHRNALAVTITAAVLLGGVCVVSGLAADDHIHQLIVSGSTEMPGVAHGRLDQFRFATPTSTPILMNDGVLPWWADPKVNFGFFRPLTGAARYLDHALFGDDPVWMHVHTMLWHALGLLGLWWLYRDLLVTRWVAVLSLFLYGLDDARGGPLTWIANRHAVIGTTLSVWCLWCFHHALHMPSSRTGTQRVRLAVTAWLLFGLALLASQGSVSVLGYVFGHALFLQTDHWKARVLRLSPYAGLLIGWAVWSRSLGYGIEGSDVYFDPASQPLLYARALIERGPILWLAQLAAPWSEVWNVLPVFAPWAMPLLWMFGIAVLGVWTHALLPLLRRNATTRMFAVGALASTLPAAAAFPADRLLTWLAIGACPMLAQWFASFAASRAVDSTPTSRDRIGTLLAASVIGLHLILGPLLLPGRALGTLSTRRSLDLADHSVPQTPDIATKTVVIINPPSDAYVGYIPYRRAAEGVPRPSALRWLATGITDVTVERVDARTLRVHQAGGYLQAMSEQLLRSPRTPFVPGEIIALRGFEVEIATITEDGRPLEVLIRFEADLEDARYLWLMWRDKGYVPFSLPAVGERTVVPHVDPVKVAIG